MKNVLFVSYYWPPAGGVSVNRILRFYKYLPQFGWNPIILTTEGGDFPFVDESLTQEVRPETKVYRAKNVSLFAALKGVKANASSFVPYGFTDVSQDTWKSKLMRFLKFNIVPDTRILWANSAYRVAKEILQAEKVDLIFSSSPPQTNHLIASKLSKTFKIPWVADLRDPWSDVFWVAKHQARLPWISSLDMKIEKSTLSKASHLVSVTPSWVQRYQERIGVETSLIYNGYEPKMFEADDNESTQSGSNDSVGKFHIVYSGSMSYHQRPTLFFEAIKELITANNTPKELKVTFIGNYAPFLSNMVAEYGLESLVEFVPFGSMQTAVSYMKAADMLLINGVQGEDDGVIPSKLFDYFGARKPILAFDLSGNAESLLYESGQGYSFHVSKDSPSKVASIILDVMKVGNSSGNSEFDPSIYSRVAQTQQLAQIFDDVWSSRHH